MSDAIDYDTGDQHLDDVLARLDALERDHRLLSERVDLIRDAGAELTEVVGGLLALATMQPVPSAPAPRLPEDVPQNVRTGEDRPQ
jgi:hypothetical protein